MLQMHITKNISLFSLKFVVYHTSRLAFYVICVQVDHDCENTFVVSFVASKGLLHFNALQKAQQDHLNSRLAYESQAIILHR